MIRSTPEKGEIVPVTGFYALGIIAVVGVVGPLLQRIAGDLKKSKGNTLHSGLHGAPGTGA